MSDQDQEGSNLDNSGDANTEVEDQKDTETKVDADTGATDEPEFKDPGMQKAWTEKTQALAEERKAIEQEREDWGKEREGFTTKAKAFDTLTSHPSFNDYYQKNYKAQKPAEPEIPVLTAEQMDEFNSDPEKLQNYIMGTATKIADSKIQPLVGKMALTSDKVQAMEFERNVSDYARENKDFWDLDDKKLIEPYLKHYRTQMPHASDIEVIAKAHKHAKGIYDKVVEDAGKSAMEKTHNMVEQKKAAAGDTGTGNSVNVSKNQKGDTFSEMLNNNVEDAGIDW